MATSLPTLSARLAPLTEDSVLQLLSNHRGDFGEVTGVFAFSNAAQPAA
jgi:hypothetical protein